MRKLMDKYILQHFIAKMFMTLLAFIVIFVVVDIVDHLDKFIDTEMPRGDIIRYYRYTVPWFLSIGLPMSLLLATVFTLGVLQKNHELTALKASGISVKRLSIPILLMGVLFSLFSFYFDNLVVTENFQKRTELEEKYSLTRSKQKKIKKKDIFRQTSESEVLGIRRYQFRSHTAHDVSIQKFSDGDLVYRVDAPVMNWNSAEAHWVMPECFTRDWQKDSLIYSESKRDSILHLKFTPTDLTQASVRPEEMNFWELRNFVKKLNEYGVKDPRWAVNMHFKPAFACTSFLMILFGLSLSIRRPRSSMAVGIGISVFVIFLYFAGIKTGQTLGFKGTLPPLISVWLPNLIFFSIGAYLFKQTRT